MSWRFDSFQSASIRSSCRNFQITDKFAPRERLAFTRDVHWPHNLAVRSKRGNPKLKTAVLIVLTLACAIYLVASAIKGPGY